MDLRLQFDLAANYSSAAQRARVVTEAWGARNLYCCSCAATQLAPQTANTHVVDFKCPDCAERYQLKSSKSGFRTTVLGANYDKMMEAVRANRTPHFHLLHYVLPEAMVRNLVVIPRFAISSSAIRPRNPLSKVARRAAWVGYLFDLRLVPSTAKIALIHEGEIIDPVSVRAQFGKIARIASLSVEQRGWSLDVLRCLESLHCAEFTTSEAYQFVPELSALHPANRHIREKIRQQLQVLRDRGLLRQVDRGRWTRV